MLQENETHSQDILTLMYKLDSLKQLGTKLQRLDRMKKDASNRVSLLNTEAALVREYVKERDELLLEKKVNQLITSTTSEKEQLTNLRQQLINEHIQPLKDEVDAVRSQFGMEKTPNLQDEQDGIMTEYLERRRNSWKDTSSERGSIKNGRSRNKKHRRS